MRSFSNCLKHPFRRFQYSLILSFWILQTAANNFLWHFSPMSILLSNFWFTRWHHCCWFVILIVIRVIVWVIFVEGLRRVGGFHCSAQEWDQKEKLLKTWEPQHICHLWLSACLFCPPSLFWERRAENLDRGESWVGGEMTPHLVLAAISALLCSA